MVKVLFVERVSVGEVPSLKSFLVAGKSRRLVAGYLWRDFYKRIVYALYIEAVYFIRKELICVFLFPS